ncbi:MAG: AraC family transcriptional regulator [Lachnospiraceae bacterium]|nr:AraC family transcriptional regulator [Lachnospiraceae bacterium]
MLPYTYVLFRDIQKTKADYYKEHGCGLSFQGAVQMLANAGICTDGIPENPDFLSWNLTSYQELRRLVGQIPIALTEIQNIKQAVHNDIRRLSVYNHVQIAIEACCSDMQLISVDYFSVCYVLEGSCLLKILSGERRLHSGELCIIPPGIPHALFTMPEDLVVNIVSAKEHFTENFSQLLYRDNIVSAFFRHALFQEARDPIFFTMHASRNIRSLIQHLFAEFITKDSYSETLFNNYLQIFYANIIRASENPDEVSLPSGQTISRTRMPAILNYVRQNYHTLTLDTLARHFHYDSAYLSKQIRLATGKNYSDIVTELKIAEARELLAASEMSIEKIAETVGYHSSDHFGYVFKKETGLSPRQYRRQTATIGP